MVKSSDILADSLKDIDPLPDLPDLQEAKDVLSRMKDGEVNLLDVSTTLMIIYDKVLKDMCVCGGRGEWCEKGMSVIYTSNFSPNYLVQ